MKKITSFFQKCNFLVLLLAAVLLASLIEIFLFNFHSFSQKFSDVPRVEIDLSAYEGYNGEALPLLPENPTVAFNNLNVPVHSLTVQTAGPAQVLSGNIGICDEANAYSTMGAGSFQVNPGGHESVFTVRINSRGDLSRLRITFTDELSDPVFLTSVVLNEQLPVQIHALRLALMAGLTLPVVLFYDGRIVNRLSKLKLDFIPARSMPLLKAAWPMMVNGAMMTLLTAIPRYVLEMFHGAEVLGVYTAIATPAVTP